jgi:hypothetical protein
MRARVGVFVCVFAWVWINIYIHNTAFIMNGMIDIWGKIRKYGQPILIYYILGIILYRIFNYVTSQDTVDLWTFLSVSLFSLTEILLALIIWISQNHAKNKEPENETPITLSKKQTHYLDDENYRTIAIMCLDNLPTFELRKQYESWQTKQNKIRDKNVKPFSELLRELEKKEIIKYSTDTSKWVLSSQVYKYLIKYHPTQKTSKKQIDKELPFKEPDAIQTKPEEPDKMQGNVDSEVNGNFLFRVIMGYKRSYREGVLKFGVWWKILQASMWGIVGIFLVVAVILVVFFLPQIESIFWKLR